MTTDHPRPARRAERRYLIGWSLLVATGLVAAWLAVRGGARLGTSAAPFLGTYRWGVDATVVAAPAVAAAVLYLAARGWPERLAWPAVKWGAYLAALAWTTALAATDGRDGFAVRWRAPEWLDAPPDGFATGLVLTALGALYVPLVLTAVRNACGETPARRYAVLLALAPYAVWFAASLDAIVAMLGAAMIAAGVRASDAHRTGPAAGGWAITSGLLLGTAALFSYAVPWLGLSVACLYFARRRALLNLSTAAGALVPVIALDLAGHDWVDGLVAAQADPVLWWGPLNALVLLLAAGPALYASLAKLRNTPGWPFLVGAGAAVLSALFAGPQRGGVEHAWLPFFGWLTVAAIAPLRQAGPPVPTPLLLAGAAAVTGTVLAAVLP